MKYMKIGSKPDLFLTNGNNVRYVASELATDVIVIVGEVKFYLHKFPLLSKCACLRKLATETNGRIIDEIDISDIPGGTDAFEVCAKFCYSITVTLNAYNVVAVRCAAEYLGMHETIEKGNLVYKVDIFLSSSIFRCWKDSIIVLQSTQFLLPMSEELKLVSKCIEYIARKACSDSSKVNWSYTYRRKQLPEDNVKDTDWNSTRGCSAPQDWWIEDLCALEVDLYKRVLTKIRNQAILSDELIAQALKAYAYRRVPGFSRGEIQSQDAVKHQSILESIVWLLPSDKDSVPCNFLLKLLKAAISLDCRDMVKRELIRRAGQQLEGATVNDLLIRAPERAALIFDVGTVHKMVEEFLKPDEEAWVDHGKSHNYQITRRPRILSDASKTMVAKLTDGYLAVIAKDPNLPVSKFVDLAELVSGFPRPSHDGLYRAIDTYLKEHPVITKSERKRICKLMDCKKLSLDACMHAVQNERLPLRVIVQVFFCQQVRASASSSGANCELPKAMVTNLSSASVGSSRSVTTYADPDWDVVDTAEELKALREELAALRMANRAEVGQRNDDGKNCTEKAAVAKVRRLLKTKNMFYSLWPIKAGHGENSGSDSSGSISSANPEEAAAKSTPYRNMRLSVSAQR